MGMSHVELTLYDGESHPNARYPAPASRLTGDGEDQPDLQVRAYLFQMLRGEVAPIVGVQDIGDATHDPAWVFFPPDRLPQRERCVQRGRLLK